MEQEITPLTKEDKRLILQGFSLRAYKIFHVAFAVIFLLASIITIWKFNDNHEYESVAGFSIWFLLVFNFLFLCDYLFHKIQIIGAQKIMLTGKVTNIYESGAEHGGTIVCFNNREFDITWAKKIPEFMIGDIVTLHFVYRKNKRTGSIITITKA